CRITERDIAELRALVRAEEEEPVLDNRPAQAAAVLIALELIRSQGEKVAGVEGAIAQELERRSVESVGSRFRHDVDYGPGSPAIFGAVVVGLDTELVQRVRIGNGIVDV